MEPDYLVSSEARIVPQRRESAHRSRHWEALSHHYPCNPFRAHAGSGRSPESTSNVVTW